MRNFDSRIHAELQKENLTLFFLLELQLSTTQRFADIDIDVFHGSNRFYARPFSFQNLSGSSALSVDNLDIDIDDTDQAISALLLGEDCRNKTAILYIGVIANNTVPGCAWETGVEWEPGVVWQPEYTDTQIVTEEFSRFIVGGWELADDNKARITLTNELVLWSKKTLRVQSASCQWVFWSGGIEPAGSPECKYSGSETWCDHSYERCKALGNQINFPGNRFLPSLMNKEIWWGRTQSYSGS